MRNRKYNLIILNKIIITNKFHIISDWNKIMTSRHVTTESKFQIGKSEWYFWSLRNAKTCAWQNTPRRHKNPCNFIDAQWWFVWGCNSWFDVLVAFCFKIHFIFNYLCFLVLQVIIDELYHRFLRISVSWTIEKSKPILKMVSIEKSINRV